jgi:phage terminase large subunit-like protein
MGIETEFRRLADEAALLEDEELERYLRGLPAPVRRLVEEAWCLQAHDGQEEPQGDWRVWLMMAGRGFGKTRAGAEWVWARVRARERRPSTSLGTNGLGDGGGGLRIALVGANMDDVEKVMVKGESGLAAVAGAGEGVRWVASRRMAVFEPSGAQAFAYSGEKPDKLRGPQHHFAWCDELAKWSRGQAAWDNLMLGMRLGERPRTLVTTTPRPIALLKAIRKLERCTVTRGRTRDNSHLPEDFTAAVEGMYAGTRLGRQELEGELIEDVEGALWTREMIEASRTPLDPSTSLRTGFARDERVFRRIVIGVDPPAGVDGDACGIVVVGLGADGAGYVLEDASVGGLSPDGWAAAVARAAAKWRASRVVAEANQGGKMVEAVLRAAEPELPLKLVHASDGKAARAEPVAVLFERGRVKFAGCFPALEDELAGLTMAGGYEGPGRSPDRADAMVWALSELMLGKDRTPRVLTF